MLNNYLPDDICNIIKEKLLLDYKKYKFWCCNECKWVYTWTTCDVRNLNIKCPNDNKHEVNLDCIRLVTCIKSNDNILLFDKTKKIDNIIQTDFELINI
jgi:hypothetical protein